jgi:hypothetical protein
MALFEKAQLNSRPQNGAKHNPIVRGRTFPKANTCISAKWFGIQ